MMDISYTDSWDKIQERYLAGEPDSHAHLNAKAALEIKSNIESIKNTKKLAHSTWVLAIFTICLCCATVAYTFISYYSYQGSKEQIKALNALTKSVLELPKTEHRLKVLQKAHDERIEKQKNVMPRQKSAVSGRH